MKETVKAVVHERGQGREPVLKAALGADWHRLPEALRKNFDLQPGSNGQIVLSGTMYEIRHSLLAKLLIFPAQLVGALVPWQGENVPVTIEISAQTAEKKCIFWRRTHNFPSHAPFIFSSRMEYLHGNEIIEKVGCGLGMRMQVSLEDDILKLTSICYQWDIFGRIIRIPNWLLLGTGQIIERAVSADQFEMFFEINHPWLGRTFSYNGIFRFEKQTADVNETILKN